ncbi:SIMPL domain-containing protein [Solimonas sp. SE-A11]|uniref:SIMPL domain-containing protein n=1 Tax=Solimonas sp. SE-A11 TaxID=3054954 RepID=UPI00259D15CD|nr:SIMPL domain-containing protein [Solimonas sp. SE-A11]MDM4770546.1 SIMPL domain-containing protein [Solimonas sp. SE-A11]
MNKFAVALMSLPLLASATAWADQPPQRRSVNVSGQGEVAVRPDRAKLNVAIDTINADPKAAEAEVNKVVRAYVAEARQLGAKDADISTAGISLTPEYVWDDKSRRNRLTGYRARRDITVTVTDLNKLGDYVLRATQVGVNNVSPPVLEASNARELSRQALVKATDDARGKAQLLADTLKVKLGSIYALNASEGYSQPPMPMMARGMAKAEAFDSGNSQMGLEPGEIKYTATVNADFDLLTQ